MTRKTMILTFLALASTAGLLSAGPLDPPPGPVTSTYKTLSEVEPRTAISAINTPGDSTCLFKITQPGSYYLVGNITGVLGKNGISIAASGVTIDLNGFDLFGIAGSFDGVTASGANVFNVAITNGSIHNWGGDGIDLSGVLDTCRITNVLAKYNSGAGIRIPNLSTIASCLANANFGVGFACGAGCNLTACSAGNNGGTGIVTGATCTLTSCTASNNTGSGMSTGDYCTVTDCAASLNSGTAVGFGIKTGSHCTVTRCTAGFNSFVNGGAGINTGIGCAVSECVASTNGQGVSTGDESVVASCVVDSNSLDGIKCTASCVIRGNACANNGSLGDGAGIHAVGTDNRIEGNNCSGADRGIDVDAAGNVIIRNTCSGNALNWDVVAGNVILVVNAVVAGAVTGNSGGAAPGSTDPNANFTY